MMERKLESDSHLDQEKLLLEFAELWLELLPEVEELISPSLRLETEQEDARHKERIGPMLEELL
jgi:hypothetical protein